MVPVDLGLRDRVYIVTGASAGLGFASAKALAAEGARLVISSRNEESITRAADELGENVVGISVDNADPESAERLAASAARGRGRHWTPKRTTGEPRSTACSSVAFGSREPSPGQVRRVRRSRSYCRRR
jgi:3-oxoacyl-[acyl-carrier protein] reductase